MPTSYPSAIDTFSNPIAGDALSSAVVPHAAQHANANDAIEAIEAFVGTSGAAFPGGLNATGAVKGAAHDNLFGVGALGAAGCFVDVGSLGTTTQAFVVAGGTPTDVPLILRGKGIGKVIAQSGAGADGIDVDGGGTAVDPNGDSSLRLRQNNTMKRVHVGAADSAGTGFRTLRVAN